MNNLWIWAVEIFLKKLPYLPGRINWHSFLKVFWIFPEPLQHRSRVARGVSHGIAGWLPFTYLDHHAGQLPDAQGIGQGMLERFFCFANPMVPSLLCVWWAPVFFLVLWFIIIYHDLCLHLTRNDHKGWVENSALHMWPRPAVPTKPLLAGGFRGGAWRDWSKIKITYPLVMTNIAIENGQL